MTIFYEKEAKSGLNRLSEEESKHCTQVLRYQKGDEIMIFDGAGGMHRSILTQVSKKMCEFEIIESKFQEPKGFSIHLVVAPTKNADRVEWMIEKLSEIGVDQVSFAETQHSERRKLRTDRLEKKAISAMKQSGNPWLLKLNELTSFSKLISSDVSEEKFIAHVNPEHPYLGKVANPGKSVTILIGPEGDFSSDELRSAIAAGFLPVSIGQNALRTETAGLIACSMINMLNQY